MIRQAIHDIDPEQPVYDVRTMSDVVERSLGQRWLNMALLVTFAIAALLLCAIGVYGVIAFGVTRQRREFGIRLALGATRGAIARRRAEERPHARRDRHRRSAWSSRSRITRAMQSLLFGVSSSDLVSYGVGDSGDHRRRVSGQLSPRAACRRGGSGDHARAPTNGTRLCTQSPRASRFDASSIWRRS